MIVIERYKKEVRIIHDDSKSKYYINGQSAAKINNYKTNTELFDNALYDLFEIRYNNNMSANMSRIYNKKTRNNITSQYNY